MSLPERLSAEAEASNRNPDVVAARFRVRCLPNSDPVTLATGHVVPSRNDAAKNSGGVCGPDQGGGDSQVVDEARIFACPGLVVLLAQDVGRVHCDERLDAFDLDAFDLGAFG